MLEVYALVLLAGFQGKYNYASTKELSEIRKKLLKQVADKTIASDGANINMGLFPESLGTVAGQPKPKAGAKLSIILLVTLPVLILLALYFYLDFQIQDTVNDLIKPLQDQ